MKKSIPYCPLTSKSVFICKPCFSLLIQTKWHSHWKKAIVWIEKSYFSKKQWFEVNNININNNNNLDELSLINIQLFSTPWSGVDNLWIIVMFLSAVWTLILTAPIQCRASIDEQVMQCYISPNLMKKQWILDGLRVSSESSRLNQERNMHRSSSIYKLNRFLCEDNKGLASLFMFYFFTGENVIINYRLIEC